MSPATHGGPVPPGKDPDEYDRLRRRILWQLPTGLYLVGSRAGDERNLMAANLVTQVATEPKLVGVAVERDAVTHRLVAAGGGFTVCLLRREDRAVVRTFAKPVTHAQVDAQGRGTLQGEQVVATRHGLPILAASAAWLECTLRHTLDLGSHSWFVGEVTDCGATGTGAGGGPDAAAGDVLRMEDTRMHYGG